MFGFYNPRSLSFGADSAVIDFINAQNASDVTQVVIRDAEHARRVAGALEVQLKYGVTTKEGDIIDFRGSIALNPKDPSQAILTPEGDENFGKTYPLVMPVGENPDAMPRLGYAMGKGVWVDGAIMVHKIAMRSFTFVPERSPQPSAAH